MKILSLRGGGIRGVATAAFLAKLEETIGCTCHEMFDLIAGTSTGAIIAVGLGLGIPASEVLAFYLDEGAAIFKKRFGHRIGLVSSRYDSTVLVDRLNSAFGYKWLKAAKTRVMVATTRMDDLSARFWKSWRHDVLAGLAAASSAAAPIYFDPIAIKDMQHEGKRYVDGSRSHCLYGDVPGRVEHYADGGLFANDPALVALSEARYLLSDAVRFRGGSVHLDPGGMPSKISILDVACPNEAAPAAIEPGILGFGPEIVGTFMYAGQDCVEEILRRELGDDYRAVKPSLTPMTKGFVGIAASAAIDDASIENMWYLRVIGELTFSKVAREGLFGEDVKKEVERKLN